MIEKLRAMEDSPLSPEAKAEFISESRRIVGDMTDPNRKLVALTMLAVKVKALGDDKLAREIILEANGFVKSEPVNFMDYMQTWAMIGGFASVSPDDAFPLLENTIFRINDTIEAFIKVAQFIDVGNDIVVDGEVQVGAFGGSMIRDLVTTFNNSGGVIKDLAVADFDRTRAAADGFERNEVRILARMLILRSVLGKDNAPGMKRGATFLF